jgi:hypothetical protein
LPRLWPPIKINGEIKLSIKFLLIDSGEQTEILSLAETYINIVEEHSKELKLNLIILLVLDSMQFGFLQCQRTKEMIIMGMLL